MPDLSELYREMIFDHNRQPRNFRVLEENVQTLEGYNPLCGDRFTLYLHLVNDVIQEIAFQGSGCAISKASASMMTETVKGKKKEEAEDLFQKFQAMVTRDKSGSFDPQTLGKLAVFSGVCEFPVRVKCATLAWHTLKALLEGWKKQTVSTE